MAVYILMEEQHRRAST